MRLQQGKCIVGNIIASPEELCESGKIVGQGSLRLPCRGVGDGVPDRESNRAIALLGILLPRPRSFASRAKSWVKGVLDSLAGVLGATPLTKKVQQDNRTIGNVITPPEELCESGKVVGQGSPRLPCRGVGDGVPDKERAII